MKTQILISFFLFSLICIEFNPNGTFKHTDFNSQESKSICSEILNPSSFDKDFQLAYIKNGELFFYNIKSSKKSLFPETRKIFNAVFYDDGNTMYYTVIGKEEKLELVKAKLTDKEPTINNIAAFNYYSDYFLTQTYLEKGRLVIINDTIYAECNYDWLNAMLSSIKYDIKNKTLIPQEEGNPLYSYEQEMKNSRQAKFAALRNKITIIEKENIPDLYITSENKTIRLTNTSSFKRETDLYSIAISYEISADSSKILFSFVTTFGDLPHGPYCVVNIDGTNQVMLIEDGVSSDHIRPAWMPDGSSLLYIDDEKNLNLMSGAKNTIVKIDSEVDYFLIRD